MAMGAMASKNFLKNWLKDAAEELVAEIAILTVFAAGCLLLRAINWGLRMVVGPRLAPIVWVLLSFAALLSIAAYLIRRAEKPCSNCTSL
jgi:hypothetical protein